MRIRPGVFAALAITAVTFLGPVPALAIVPSEDGVSTTSTTDPFDESNAVNPGDEALGEVGEIEIAPSDDLPVPVPSKTTGPPMEPDAPRICDPNESWLTKWQSVKSTNTITHASGYVVPAGGSGKITKSAEYQVQISASITYSTSATVSAKVVQSGLEAQTGWTLAAAGQFTTTSNQSVETSVTKAGTHVFFVGRRVAEGSFIGKKCNSAGTTAKTASGVMETYTIPYEGAVWCGENPAAKSFKFYAKKYCDD